MTQQEPPLIGGYISLEEQVQPNGIDLTLREVAMLQSSGRIAVENSQRVESYTRSVRFQGSLRDISFITSSVSITGKTLILPRSAQAAVAPNIT